jgi:hypothetical protein
MSGFIFLDPSLYRTSPCPIPTSRHPVKDIRKPPKSKSSSGKQLATSISNIPCIEVIDTESAEEEVENRRFLLLTNAAVKSVPVSGL